MRHLAVGMVLLAMASAMGANYVWTGTESSSWAAPSSYTLDGAPATSLPQPGDTVSLPANASATVDDDDIARVSALARLTPATGAKLYVNISTNAVMGCAIAGASTSVAYGTLVKRGAGTLTLTSGNAVSSSKAFLDCFTALEIEAGDVVLPQGNAALSSKYYEMGVCTVAEGCTLRLPDTCATYVSTLNGGGTVTNASAATRNLRLKGATHGAFTGTIGGPGVSLEVYGGSVDLLGTANTFAKDFAMNGGTVGAMDLGTTSASASSIGLDTTIEARENGGTLRYLGSAGGIFDKAISIYASATGGSMPFTADGGAHGGLTFTGEWKFFTNTSHAPFLRRIVLAGSNETECVVANRISNASSGGTNYTFSLTKTGSGVWRLADNAERVFSGSVAVDEGTLRFDSIDETNVVCALGKATDTFGDLEGLKDEDRRLPYAIRLGSAEAQGVFEYTGAGFAQTRTRAIGLAGNARIRHNGTDGFLRLLSGVSAVTPGAKTLTLDGNGTVDCEVANIADGSGKVSVAKDGTGIWALTGELAFSGTLRVKAGTLYLRNPDRYNWFRLVIRENLGSAQTRLHEIGLFDSASNRVPLSAISAYATARGNLQYGEAALERDANAQSSYPLQNLFDDNGSSHTRFQMTPVLSNDATWIYIVMRVPADANVASFDYAPYNNGNYTDSGLKDILLQASLDGASWTTLYAESNEPATSNSKWHYNVESVTAGGKHAGKEIDTAIPQTDRATCFLDNVSTVRVDADATLVLQGDVKLSRLTVDLAGAGTVVGGSLAASGTLDLTGAMTGASMPLPLTFQGVDGLANATAWRVTVDGVPNDGIKLLPTEGGLMLKARKGFSVTVR